MNVKVQLNMFHVIVDCPAGTRKTDSKDACEDCPANYYQPGANEDECIACPGDKITGGSGSDALLNCCKFKHYISTPVSLLMVFTILMIIIPFYPFHCKYVPLEPRWLATVVKLVHKIHIKTAATNMIA